ncbi:MAG: DASS family sodium-coupled anion symporter [Bacteroidota bacterium]
MTKKQIFLLLGPLLFLILWLIGTPEDIPPNAYLVLISTLWIALWWVTEAVPIPITSLLPIILYPLLGIIPMNEVVVPFSKPIIFLFIGGFILALAMEKWNLHRRIALTIISKVGTNLEQIVGGFVLATGFLSMWISNTATTMMMIPIGFSIIQQFDDLDGISKDKVNDFGKALLLAVAYSASIGGMATLVGTPTNLIFAEAIKEFYNVEIAFDQWFRYGLPISLLLLAVCWWHIARNIFQLHRVKFKGDKSIIDGQLAALGKMTGEEKRVLIIFLIVAFAWISRKHILSPSIPGINDTHIALIGALLLFMIPAPSKKASSLMDWETAIKLPWGILLLFGGAFAVAAGFEQSGLTTWLGEQLSLLSAIPYFLLLLFIITVVNFLTEITQNMATCTLMMPVLAGLALAIDVHPYGLMVATCIAASCAFMLPFATAPNAIVFGSGILEIRDMIRVGFLLNILSIIVITLFTYFLMPVIWDIDLTAFPDWLKN